jgi:hypothetical protein
VADSLAYLHVFAWGSGGIAERYPLADGAELWQPALAIAAEAPPLPAGLPRYGLLEYVADDDPEQLVRTPPPSTGGSPGVMNPETLPRWFPLRGQSSHRPPGHNPLVPPCWLVGAP